MNDVVRPFWRKKINAFIPFQRKSYIESKERDRKKDIEIRQEHKFLRRIAITR